MLDALPTVLTVEEVAKMLRIGRNSAYEAIRRGELPAIAIGRRILVPRHALERLLAGALTKGDETTETQSAVAEMPREQAKRPALFQSGR